MYEYLTLVGHNFLNNASKLSKIFTVWECFVRKVLDWVLLLSDLGQNLAIDYCR